MPRFVYDIIHKCMISQMISLRRGSALVGFVGGVGVGLVVGRVVL